MGASDYNQDIGIGLSTGVNRAQIDRAHNEMATQKQTSEIWAVGAFIVVTLIVLLAAYAVVQHRRKIARATDAAVIGGLAAGVRVARVARSRRDGLIARVLAKADEKTTFPE